MTDRPEADRANAIAENLPYLRRYARALTGSQARGDRYAAAALEALLGDDDGWDTALPPRTALFKLFHGIWESTGGAMDGADPDTDSAAHRHLARLTSQTREALLLNTIEGFDHDSIGHVLSCSAEEARRLVSIAYEEMAKAITGDVMIIEDEAIIAVDLEAIVAGMGHRVTGVASTETAAVGLADTQKPNLILSDIQLADGSSGIDAVRRITETHGDIPVVFITAFPERLLTGAAEEPAFLISKPYTEDQVRSAVSQAMFFSSAEATV